MDRKNALEAFGRLLDIMDDLRAKCPWDKKQTMESLRHLTVEETYELNDAIIDEDLSEISKELGDLLLHIVFYAKIGDEKEAFDITSVIDGICEKLISRHPHIYGDVEVADEEEVKANWEKLKLKEGKKSVLEGVPNSLPSLVKAIRIQDKARGIGFDWDHKEQVWEKIQEELGELKAEVEKKSEMVQDEFGDVLFSLINYARFLNINPDDALEGTNRKFIKRFQFMEKAISKDEKVMSEMKLAELDEYWERSKVEA
ncbi:MAG: nucleoside triphosphate pyrophosphohydrolase [Flavobacteriales bacterium]|nr:nucleoside triphosphate pyrophosphohydrolase [Flavobacteriales bacterium]NNK80835.1 nucleoside triphosphate pyrophosphohydrolase [Flavobacteriales bacterium]